jgi:hypothetical protein
LQRGAGEGRVGLLVPLGAVFSKFFILNIEYPPAIAIYADTCKIVVLHIGNVILAILINRHWRAG